MSYKVQSRAYLIAYTYDDYGKTLTSTGSVYNPFKYTGEYTDSESGFIYLRARYYDPESQQFLTVDPALAWTEQAYAYGGGSPTNVRDPRGLQSAPPPSDPWQALMDLLFGPSRGTFSGPFTGRSYDTRLADAWSAGTFGSREAGLDYHFDKWGASTGASPEEFTLRGMSFREGYGPSAFCTAENDPGATNPAWSRYDPGWRIQIPTANGDEVGWYSMEDGTIQTYRDPSLKGPSSPDAWLYEQLTGKVLGVDEAGNAVIPGGIGGSSIDEPIQLRLPLEEP